MVELGTAGGVGGSAVQRVVRQQADLVVHAVHCHLSVCVSVGLLHGVCLSVTRCVCGLLHCVFACCTVCVCLLHCVCLSVTQCVFVCYTVCICLLHSVCLSVTQCVFVCYMVCVW